MIIDSGIANLFELSPLMVLGPVGRVIAQCAASASSINQRAKMESYSGPLLLLHTANDQIVDKSHAQRLLDWGAGAAKNLVLFSRGDHNSILEENAREYLAAVRSFYSESGSRAERAFH